MLITLLLLVFLSWSSVQQKLQGWPRALSGTEFNLQQHPKSQTLYPIYKRITHGGFSRRKCWHPKKQECGASFACVARQDALIPFMCVKAKAILALVDLQQRRQGYARVLKLPPTTTKISRQAKATQICQGGHCKSPQNRDIESLQF